MMSPVFPQPDREDRLLLALLHINGPTAAYSLLDGADLDIVLSRAHRHQVQPLVVDALLEVQGAPLDPIFAHRLAKLQKAWAARFMLMEMELQQASDTLARGGVAGLVLKGPAIARAAYREAALRAFADLDLLVPRRQFSEALRLLECDGFRLKNPDQSKRYHRPFHYHDLLLTPKGFVLELHWGLSCADDLFALHADSFIEHAVSLDSPPGFLLTSPTDLLLHTAAQSLSDGYHRLLRTVDADRLLRTCADQVDWDRLEADARRGRLSSALWLACSIARDLLGTPLPAHHERLRPAAWVRAGIASLTPATLQASRFALDHPGLGHLYTAWLAVGGWRRVRATVRIVRLQTMIAALREPETPWSQRAAEQMRQLASLVKLLLFQAVRLALFPFFRR